MAIAAFVSNALLSCCRAWLYPNGACMPNPLTPCILFYLSYHMNILTDWLKMIHHSIWTFRDNMNKPCSYFRVTKHIISVSKSEHKLWRLISSIFLGCLFQNLSTLTTWRPKLCITDMLVSSNSPRKRPVMRKMCLWHDVVVGCW